MEEDRKADTKKAANHSQQRSRARRQPQSSRPFNLSNGENSPQIVFTDNAASSFGVRVRNMDEIELPQNLDSSADTVVSTSADSTASGDYPNGSGLNGIRQFDIDTQLASDDVRLNSGDTLNTVSFTSNQRNRNASPTTSHPQVRRRARRRPTHQNPGQSRAETSVRNPSPSRQTRSYYPPVQHAPPLRFSAVPSAPSPETSPVAESATSRFMDDLFGATGQLGPFPNPYLRGYGTEDEPFELSPGLSDDSSGSPPFSTQGCLQSDEEIARQLQQEEWEAASSYRGHNPRSARTGGFSSYHYPHVRIRTQEMPPLRLTRPGTSRRTGGQAPSGDSSYQLFGGSGSQATASSPVFRPPGHRRRSQDEYLPVRTRLEHWSNPPEDTEESFGNLASLTDLLSSYGLSDWAEIEAFLNPGVVGQRRIINPDFMDYESLLALGEQLGEVSKGLQQSEIDKLSICMHDGSTARQGAGATAASDPELPKCYICLCDYEEGDEKRVLPCKHEFHKNCVDQWLKTNATCPVCRSEVRIKDS